MKRRRLLNSVEPEVETRPCEAPGCTAEALYRAPRSPSNMSENRWFCLDHAREYNLAWDFFAGMSQAQIEEYRRQDVTGHRPTWPFGLGQIGIDAMNNVLMGKVGDGLGLFTGTRPRAKPAAEPRISPEKRQALAKLNLPPGSSKQEIKDRYKELVKRYHPDLNGGDRGGEEQLRVVNEAYRTLIRRSA